MISDFLTHNGYQIGLRSVRELRQEVALLQILSPDEIEPDVQGDWQLRDSEGSGRVDISATPAVLQAYQQRLLIFMQDLASFAHAQAMTFAIIPSDTALKDVEQRLLRQVEIVK